MAQLGPQKRNKIKKLKAIEAMEAKEGELNEEQLKKVHSKNELKQEIEKLDYYINLYEKAHPFWNMPEEEMKVEEPVEVIPTDEVIN